MAPKAKAKTKAKAKATTKAGAKTKPDHLAEFVASVVDVKTAEDEADDDDGSHTEEEIVPGDAAIEKRPSGAYKGKRDRAKNHAFQNMLGELPEHVRHMYENAKVSKKTDIINALLHRDGRSDEWQLALNAPMFEDHTFEAHA
jgi:hypothetical protein